MSPDDSLIQRIDRLESCEAIRQLASRYALGVDTRNLDLLMECFPADIQVGRGESGRRALRDWYERTLRRFTGTAHIVCNHVIEFDDSDHARGVVYCRAEHEMGDRFMIAQMQYFDRYERMGGRWHFRRRRPLFWYVTDLLERPLGAQKVRWPDREQTDGKLPAWWNSWREFLLAGRLEHEVADEGPPDTWLARLGAPPEA